MGISDIENYSVLSYIIFMQLCFNIGRQFKIKIDFKIIGVCRVVMSW